MSEGALSAFVAWLARFLRGSFEALATGAFGAAVGAGLLVSSATAAGFSTRAVLTLTSLTGFGLKRGSLLALAVAARAGLAVAFASAFGAAFSITSTTAAAFLGAFGFSAGLGASALVGLGASASVGLGASASVGLGASASVY